MELKNNEPIQAGQEDIPSNNPGRDDLISGSNHLMTQLISFFKSNWQISHKPYYSSSFSLPLTVAKLQSYKLFYIQLHLSSSFHVLFDLVPVIPVFTDAWFLLYIGHAAMLPGFSILCRQVRRGGPRQSHTTKSKRNNYLSVMSTAVHKQRYKQVFAPSLHISHTYMFHIIKQMFILNKITRLNTKYNMVTWLSKTSWQVKAELNFSIHKQTWSLPELLNHEKVSEQPYSKSRLRSDWDMLAWP